MMSPPSNEVQDKWLQSDDFFPIKQNPINWATKREEIFWKRGAITLPQFDYKQSIWKHILGVGSWTLHMA